MEHITRFTTFSFLIVPSILGFNVSEENNKLISLCSAMDKQDNHIWLVNKGLRLITLFASQQCNFSSISDIYLHINKIYYIETGVFNSKKLKKLSLGHNCLPCVPNLSNLSYENLSELSMTENQLSKCKADILYERNFTSLVNIDFDDNGLSVLPNIVLHAPFLRSLKLKHNNFKSILFMPKISPHLQDLRLKGNDNLFCDCMGLHLLLNIKHLGIFTCIAKDDDTGTATSITVKRRSIHRHYSQICHHFIRVTGWVKLT